MTASSPNLSGLQDLQTVNAAFIDELYQDWLQDPTSIDSSWQAFFATQEAELAARPVAVSRPVSDSAAKKASTAPIPGAFERPPEGASGHDKENSKQGRVTSLIWAFRDIGYLYADINPLKGYLTPDMYYRMFSVEGDYDTLSLKEYALEEADLDQTFFAGRFLQPSNLTLREIFSRMRSIYCGKLGTEVMHIQNKVMRRWILDHLEGLRALPDFGKDHKILFQKELIKAEAFEHFIHASFVGQKRFSLEGSEVLIPALTYLINQSVKAGIAEMVIGMAHRGRLNVFVNALGRPVVEIFAKFDDHYKPHDFGGNGDVKYHLGFSSSVKDEETGKEIYLNLVANPSHLEAVNPVVEGKARAQQRRRGDRTRKKVLPILIHGDAAFSGQGVIAETLNLSQLKGYKTGGTVHIIINNQIGFTTASRDARSTFFATDIAKSINIPIFHVNGDDPEAVAKAINLALLFRQKFGHDVVVDIICYRRLGHNETDEPSFTHPRMYSLIKEHASTPVIYGQKLAEEGIWSKSEQDAFLASYKASLSAELARARTGYVPKVNDGFAEGEWKRFKKEYSWDAVDTRVSMAKLEQIAKTIANVPEGFHLHPKLQKIVGERQKMFFDEHMADWGLAEALAFGTVLLDGHAVRLSGEDCQRGTFSHRHSVWWDVEAQEPKSWTALQNLAPEQGVFAVYDSPLSEFAVLGFEYGYSITMPNYLIMWEAQFGDFSNGAQVIIDQFIVSGETKWFRSSGLVMLLPHGYEGQGPEHSSAHLDRFLARCGEDNIQVVYPTSPAQIYHLLRKQIKQNFRKPLIIMSPKSLLRHKMAVSSIAELAEGRFNFVIDDKAASGQETIVLLCAGKVYYDLVVERDKRAAKHVAIVRIEQLYPFPQAELASILSRYKNLSTLRWVQEENQNHGAWSFIFRLAPQIIQATNKASPLAKSVLSANASTSAWAELSYVGRGESASPATGSHKQHMEELQILLDQAFAAPKQKTTAKDSSERKPQ